MSTFLPIIQEDPLDTSQASINLNESANSHSCPFCEEANSRLQSAVIFTQEERINELGKLLQRKTYENHGMERRINELTGQLNAQDSQLLTMMDISQEFKRLVQMDSRGTQTNMHDTSDYIAQLESRLVDNLSYINQLKERIEKQGLDRYADENSQLKANLCEQEGYESLLNVSVREYNTPRLVPLPMQDNTNKMRYNVKPIEDAKEASRYKRQQYIPSFMRKKVQMD